MSQTAGRPALEVPMWELWLRKWLFLVVAGSGILTISALHFPDFRPSGQSAGAIVLVVASVVFVGAYISAAVWLRVRGDGNPHLGDNCYYLGFSFTLTGLGATLIAIARTGVDQRGDLSGDVIGDFGVAMASTLVGFVARAAFLQFEAPESAPLALDEALLAQHAAALARLEAAVASTTVSIAAAGDALHARAAEDTQQVKALSTRMAAAAQSVLEGMDRLVAGMAVVRIPDPDVLTAGLTSAGGQLRAATVDLAIMLGHESAELAARLRAIPLPAEALFAPIEEQIARMGGLTARFDSLLEIATRGIAERIAAIELPTNLIAGRIDAVFGPVAIGAERLGAATAGLAARVEALRLPPELMVEQFEAMQQNAEALGRGVARMQEADATQHAAISSFLAALAQHQARLEDTRALERQELAMDAACRALEGLGTRLAQFDRSLSDGLGRHAVHMAEADARAETARTTRLAAVAETDALRADQAAMLVEAERLRVAFAESANAMRDLLDTIAELAHGTARYLAERR